MLYFYNPHVDDLLGTLPYFKIRGRRSVSKYSFFINQVCKIYGSVNVIVDHTSCSFLPYKILEILPYFLRFLICEFDFFIWKVCNPNLNVSRGTRISSGYGNEAIITFLWRNLESKKLGSVSEKTLNQFGLCILHCSHYFLNAQNKSENCKLIKNKFYAGDNDFSKNEFFKECFPDCCTNFLVLPFCVEEKFTSFTEFDQRESKCIATGTIISLSDELNIERHHDFLKFFGSDTYHVGRSQIYNNRNRLKNFYVMQSKMRSSSKSGKGITTFLAKFGNKQEEYFSIDIVKKYNSYQFAYAGEEITGACALGNFEAMACGCVLLGRKGYFENTGLVPGKHFLEISGDFENFIFEFENGLINGIPIERISCEKIAREGYQFIENNFRENQVFQLWKNKIETCCSQMEKF